VNVKTRGAGWRLRSVCLLMLLFSAGMPGRAAGEYQTVETASLKIGIDSDWGARTAPGYLPVRFDITNLGEARVIEIVGEGTRHFRGLYGMMPGGIDVLQSVRLARGDRVRLTIPVPVFGDNESLRFEIQENGQTLERFSYNGIQSRALPADASTLIVVDPASAFGAVAAAWARPMPAVSSGYAISGGRPMTGTTIAPTSGMPPLDLVLAPVRLPTNWLGYTSLRAVFIGPKEWEQLNDAQRSALITWTACGGDLFFVDGDMQALFPGGQQPLAAADDRSPRGYFFGRIHRPTSESVRQTGLQQVLVNAQKLQDSNWALPANGARDWGVVAKRGFRLPIAGFDGIPVRAYVGILVLFSLVIGPANYRFLRRQRQPALLVLTAPLISAVFVVLLAGYVVMGEGFAVHGRAVTVTMLDQMRNQASTRSSSSLYAAGMSPSGGLRFSRQAAVFPIGPDGKGSQNRQYLDLTEAQTFSSGLIEARSPTNVEQLTFRTARERLSFSREGGGLAVVNGLGATVTALFYREGDTVSMLSGPLSAGGRATLKTAPAGAFASVVPHGLPHTARISYLFEHQPAGSYLAVLDRSPFWEPGVAGVVEHDSFHLVIGWPEGQP
jgi:hypothetical protein